MITQIHTTNEIIQSKIKRKKKIIINKNETKPNIQFVTEVKPCAFNAFCM